MLDSRRVSGAALLLLPAALMVFFAFNSGGFFPAPPAYVAIVLCVVLMLRMLASSDPFEGAGRSLTLAGAALALYTLLTLLSERWSHTPGVALVEYDRALVYLLVMVLLGTVGRTRLRMVWILRILALALVVVCACGLVTRLLPHVWPTSPNIANQRLSFPVSYWNVLGLLAALGIVLCLHFASDAREPRASRILGAAALPVLAVTLYFTFSRGSIAVCLIALFLYAVLGRPRALLSALPAAAPATAIALKFAYDANLLATPDPTTPAAVAQGHRVAIALGACIIGAALIRGALVFLLDHRLARVEVSEHRRRRILRTGWATLVVGLIIVGIAFNGTISHQYHRFLQPAPPGTSTDLRTRLTDPGNNGRLEMWRIAWHQFQKKPVLGEGAGTFADTFAQHRTTLDFVVDAHSLYLETLDELGVVGLALLLVVIVTVLVRCALLIRGPSRPMYAAVFAVLIAWALETGIDWDWEMPTVTVVIFALGGFLLARARNDAPPPAGAPEPAQTRTPTPYMRTLLGIGCALLAVAPAYVWLSQRRLNSAAAAFNAGDYHAAGDDALSAISTLGIRAEAYELLAYSDLHRDMPKLAIRAIQKAVSLDPENWNYAYGLALMRAAAGLNPVAAAHRALMLNPKEQLTRVAWQTFSTDTPDEWQGDGTEIADALTSL